LSSSDAASAAGARSEPTRGFASREASGDHHLGRAGAAQPLLLAIETATRVMSVALLDGERVVAEISSDDARVHSERLLPALDLLLELAGAKLDDGGGASVAANDLNLFVSGAPSRVTAFFYYGASTTQTPFGNGFRCINPPFFREADTTYDRSSGPGSIARGFTDLLASGPRPRWVWRAAAHVWRYSGR
jgi:hypothetical protein